MCKVKLKSLWAILFFSLTFFMVNAQNCSDVVPLTNVSGSLCTNNLNLGLTVADATSYQWYQDGVALVGQTASSIILSDNINNVEGSYEVVATTATGCVSSEPFDVVIFMFDTYLGKDTICAGDTVIFGPFFLTTEGTFSFTTPAFQDGLGSGCDSIVTLDVIVQQDEVHIAEVTACEGTEYIFGSQILTQSGMYTEDFMSSAGCDSVVRLDLLFAPLDPIIVEAEICRGETYTFRDLTETESGMYPTNSLGAEGCDTTFILDLEVIELEVTDRAEAICRGGQIEIEGTIYDAPGTFEIRIESTTGCDNIVNLTITEEGPVELEIDEEICRGAVFELGDISATEEGVYTAEISTSGAACDSVITVNLTVIEPSPEEELMVICEGETIEWRGQTISMAGIYNDIEITAGDCDINHQLNLSTTAPVFEIIDEKFCAGGSVVINGTEYDEEGSFEIPLMTTEGCDSILQITIEELTAERFDRTENICRGEIFVLGDLEVTESGTYETTISTQGSCDSLIVVELTVDEPIPMVTNETICQGLSFEWNGEIFEEEGTFEITNTSLGECDEVFVLELKVTAPEVISESMNPCSNEFPFDFQDLKIEEAGSYSTTISVDGECDVTYVLEVTDRPVSESFMDANLCDGDTFILHDIETTVAGTFTTLVPQGNSMGCDSTVTVNLLARAIATSEEFMQACPGESIIWNGMTISEPGEHTAELTDGFGCDSIATLMFEFSSEIRFDLAFEICDGETFDDFGISETESGIYTSLFSSGVGCDSVYTIDLRVNPTSEASMDATICEGEVFELFEIQETTTGTYTTLVPGGNSFACDSTLTINLTVIPLQESEETMDICEGEVYEFNGIEYTESGTFTDTLTSSFNCDSIASLVLNVMPLGRRTDEVLICPGDEFTFNDIVTTEAGTFETLLQNTDGCDSLITVNVAVDDPDGLLILGEDKLINIGSEVDVVPEFISPSLTDFEWLDENGNLISEDSGLFAFAPVEDTWVELFATNEHGCAVSERINIEVELIIDIFVPNVINPTKESADKYFTVGANESVVGIKELFIYDRWGERMFTESHDGNLDTYLGWDGTFKSEIVFQGVYAYYVIFEIIDGTEVLKKGSLTVLN